MKNRSKRFSYGLGAIILIFLFICVYNDVGRTNGEKIFLIIITIISLIQLIVYTVFKIMKKKEIK